MRSKVDLCSASGLLMRAIAGEYCANVSVELQLLPDSSVDDHVVCLFYAVFCVTVAAMSLVSLRKLKSYF